MKITTFLSKLAAATLLALGAMSASAQPLLAEEQKPSSQWLTNIEEAKQQSKAQNKPIYLLFTGTTWCPWCIKLEKDVYAKPDFWKNFQDKFIYVKYDIGRKQTDEQTHLMDNYGVMGVPTVLILNADGKELARLGYPSTSLNDTTTPLDVHSKELMNILNRSNGSQ